MHDMETIELAGMITLAIGLFLFWFIYLEPPKNKKRS